MPPHQTLESQSFLPFCLPPSSPQSAGCGNYKSWQPHMGFLATPFLSEEIYTEDPNSSPSVWNVQIYPYCFEVLMAQETIGFWTLNQVEMPQKIFEPKDLTHFPKYSFVWSQVRKLILSIDLALQTSHLLLLLAFHSLLSTGPMKSTLNLFNPNFFSPYFPTCAPRELWLPIQLLCLDKIANQLS